MAAEALPGSGLTLHVCFGGYFWSGHIKLGALVAAPSTLDTFQATPLHWTPWLGNAPKKKLNWNEQRNLVEGADATSVTCNGNLQLQGSRPTVYKAPTGRQFCL